VALQVEESRWHCERQQSL